MDAKTKMILAEIVTEMLYRMDQYKGIMLCHLAEKAKEIVNQSCSLAAAGPPLGNFTAEDFLN